MGRGAGQEEPLPARLPSAPWSMVDASPPLLSLHPSLRCAFGTLPSPLRRTWLGQPHPSHNSTCSPAAPSSILLYQSMVVELTMHSTSPRYAAVLRWGDELQDHGSLEPLSLPWWGWPGLCPLYPPVRDRGASCRAGAVLAAVICTRELPWGGHGLLPSSSWEGCSAQGLWAMYLSIVWPHVLTLSPGAGHHVRTTLAMAFPSTHGPSLGGTDVLSWTCGKCTKTHVRS